jgi:hypothetical protein
MTTASISMFSSLFLSNRLAKFTLVGEEEMPDLWTALRRAGGAIGELNHEEMIAVGMRAGPPLRFTPYLAGSSWKTQHLCNLLEIKRKKITKACERQCGHSVTCLHD